MENLIAHGITADVNEFGVHHAASGGWIESEKFADFLRFLVGHFLKEFLGSFFGQLGEEVSSSVGSHFLDDIGGFFRVESFNDLRGEALVEFGKYRGGGFFIERGDDALALRGREFLHHFGEVGGMEVLELFVGDAEFDAAERIGLNQIDEFPADGTLREFALQSADHAGWGQALQEAADGAGQADVDLGDAELDMVVGTEFGEVDVIDADDFAASGVDDLLIEEILLDGEPAFVGLVSVEGALVDGEVDASRSDFSNLIVTSDERLEASPRDEVVGYTIGLLSGLDKEFADAADEIALRVKSGGAHEFGGVEHLAAPLCRRREPTGV